ncbi:hypothetical protein [Streptomyces sp. NBC_00582]|uniref:hypothetical protein n=1 Tax=Streptomyces sp. NBC_00582 TaxID=2975783 RepID=UPI002E80A6B6|nr:hypothetical protein [Streptomyces sp. NBC_00582]
MVFGEVEDPAFDQVVAAGGADLIGESVGEGPVELAGEADGEQQYGHLGQAQLDAPPTRFRLCGRRLPWAGTGVEKEVVSGRGEAGRGGPPAG